MPPPLPPSTASSSPPPLPPRQFELQPISHISRSRRSSRSIYAPPELPRPPSPIAPSLRSLFSPQLSSHSAGSRGSGSDIVDAQIAFAMRGNDSASSVASSSPGLQPLERAVDGLERETLFRSCLSGASVDVDELRRLVWELGVPETTWARPMTWKLLVEYLPPDRVYWTKTLGNKRARYWSMVADVTVDPRREGAPDVGDHPLSVGGDSEWREYFEDKDLRESISRDVCRTWPELSRMTRLKECLERILFVHSKTHPNVGYRQGMNELAAVFLLVFADEKGVDLSDVEADAYFCFEIIMREMAICYVGEAPGGEVEGMERQLREFVALFRIKDPVLERHLETLKIEARFYALRWVRLWLAREFPLPDLVTLWDSFLTSEQRLLWVRYVCVAMLIRIREALLMGDFVDCMKLLLHYPPCDIAEVLRTADRLRTSNVVIVRKARR